jgi:predicted Zn-dependent protease
MGKRLLMGHPNNRWLLLAQADLLAESGASAEAASLYRRMLDLPNQNQDFLHRLFDSWSSFGIAKIYKDDDPEEARRALRRIIDCGTSVCPNRDRAETMLQELAVR